MGQASPIWRLPIDTTHHLAGSAGRLCFVGGAGDFDRNGVIRHPGVLPEQIIGAISNLSASLTVESCTLGDVVRLKAFYRSDGSVNEWEVLARIAGELNSDPLPVISLIPVPLQPFEGQAIQIQAIAQRGWRADNDIRVVTVDVPREYRSFGLDQVTSGLRAGEFVSLAARTAIDAPGKTPSPGDGPAQTHHIMQSMQNDLGKLGASFQDAVKKEGYYFGTTREHWRAMAQVRASYFREPGPPATVVPCHVLWPAEALTKIEVLAMRTTRSGFDKYIPRDDHWPRRVWDWPIPLPYRQGIRLRDTIWLGGQVPSPPFDNAPYRVLPGDLAAQTAFTMSYIKDLLRGFERSSTDLKLVVCYFKSSGDVGDTLSFVKTLSDCVGGALPPVTLVPMPHMHTAESTVEIWGVAQA